MIRLDVSFDVSSLAKEDIQAFHEQRYHLRIFTYFRIHLVAAAIAGSA